MKYFDQHIVVKEDNELLRFIEGYECNLCTLYLYSLNFKFFSVDPIIGEQPVEEEESKYEDLAFAPQLSPHSCTPKFPHNE